MPWLLTRMGLAKSCWALLSSHYILPGYGGLLVRTMEKYGTSPGCVFRDKSILG